MTGLSRRGFLASAAVASAALATSRADAAGPPLLLHDATLHAGQRFAAHSHGLGGRSFAMEGDRVRQMRALLTTSPKAIFAVTRRIDELLIGEIAAETGYRHLAMVRHGANGGMTTRCAPDGASVITLARLSGATWPEAFAEMALDRGQLCAVASSDGQAEAAISWVMIRA